MRYSVEILKDCPFNGKQYKNHRKELVILDREATARVTIELEHGEMMILELGYLETDKVYDMIRQNKEINLNRTYIDGFNFAEVAEVKKIRRFSAYYAFFDGNIDFSNAEFCDGDVNFSHITYGDGDVCFYRTNFGDGDVYFHKSSFENGNVDFNSAIFGSGHVDFKFSNFGRGNIDFNGCHFGDGDVLFKGVNFGDGDVFFRNTIFGHGHADFSNLVFGKGNVYFNNTNFSDGNLDFYNTNFGAGYVGFENAIVGYGKTDFRHAVFEKGEVNFNGMLFERGDVEFSFMHFGEGDVFLSSMNVVAGSVNFSNTDFGSGNISFRNTLFQNGYVLFSNVRFGSGIISFSKTDFGKYVVEFNDISFEKGRLSFENAKADHLVFDRCVFDDYCDMRLELCEQLSLENCTFKDVFDMMKDERHEVGIHSISFINSKNLGQIYLDWHENNVKELVFGQKHIEYKQVPTPGNQVFEPVRSYDTNKKQKLEQFRMLKENFHRLGQYDDEDKAYVEFKRLERDEELHRGYYVKGNRRYRKNRLLEEILKKIRYYFNLFVLDKIGGYGTCPVNIFTTMLLTVLFFTSVYAVFPWMMEIPINNGVSGVIPKAFYLSVETFLTIGYGNICPANSIAIVVAAIEGFVGVFLMYYFTVAFVRKILR